MPKKKLRQRILARRKELSAGDVVTCSRLIQRAFIASGAFDRANVLALYSPIHNEVDTSEVLAAARAMGKAVLFPAVAGQSLIFRRIGQFDRLLQGTFGILEPGPSCEAYDPHAVDVIVVPGVVFDLHGKRVGYGKGFYDKALHQLEGQGRLVGFCYDFQLVDDITHEPHDVQMDLLITEKRVINPRD